MTRRLLVLIAVCGLLLAALAAGPAQAGKGGNGKGKGGGNGNGGGNGPDEPIRFDEEVACLEAVPAAAEPPLVGGVVNLDVVVLLDGVSDSRGQQVMGDVRRSYAPLNVNVRTSLQSVNFDGTDADGLIDQAKAHFGGSRPAGSDVVYVLTSEDIELDGDTDVAGLADCIGGVRFPHRAFAVGEDFGGDENDNVFTVNGTAKVAAHEVGHLMGGHHHYANCVEGVPSDPVNDPVSACTLMFNVVNLASLNFSTLNGAVVRGHATRWAAP